jgi:hypothetical protein
MLPAPVEPTLAVTVRLPPLSYNPMNAAVTESRSASKNTVLQLVRSMYDWIACTSLNAEIGCAICFAVVASLTLSYTDRTGYDGRVMH